MQSQREQELAARLEDAHRLSNSERLALLRDIERHAARDLYGAARLCHDHLNKAADLRLPTVVQAAPLVAKHFEERMQTHRRAIDLHFEQDKQLRQPDPQRQYVGPVIATTPKCLIQLDKETGDLIVHPRDSLVCAFEPADKDKDLTILYPQAAIGGVGLVTRMPEHTAGHDHSFAHEAEVNKTFVSLEHGR